MKTSDGSTIMVVDDLPDNVTILSRILQNRGFIVRTALSGRSALESVKIQLPDLILLDIRMPEMDGFEVCRRLKADEVTRGIPIIFISALVAVEDKVKGFQVGGIDYITKPFQADEIITRVQTHLSISRLCMDLHATNQLLYEEIEGHKKTETRLLKSEQALKATVKRLENTQCQLIQSEKMASIGRLAAGIAHEINNPIAFIASNLKTAQDYLEEIFSVVKNYRQGFHRLSALAIGTSPTPIQSIVNEIQAVEEKVDLDFVVQDLGSLSAECREGADRIQKIVTNLKDFAHPGESDQQLTDINLGLDASINLLWNEITPKAELVKEFGDIPRINGNPRQINHAFLNLLLNAAQAIEQKGIIRVQTFVKDGAIEVHISDTGRGIPEAHLPGIFDPFFTTHDVGMGTGLGLSMAYGIIKEHNGEILVESEVGQGTRFQLSFPIV